MTSLVSRLYPRTTPGVVMIILLLDSGRCCDWPDPCLYCRISTGGNSAVTKSCTWSLPSLCDCCYDIDLAIDLPQVWQKKRQSASLRAPSLIRQLRRLDLHPCGDFGQLHMHGKGAGSEMLVWMGKWERKEKQRSVPAGVHERA